MSNENNKIIQQSYRIAALTNVKADGSFKEDIVDAQNVAQVLYEQNIDNDLPRVRMHMPDGEVEYWQQTDNAFNGATGFHALAFERRNADGSTYISDDGLPQTIITFPGNNLDAGDIKLTKALTSNNPDQTADILHKRFSEVEQFTNKVAENMRARATPPKNPGHITVGAHSQGSPLALAAKTFLTEKENISVGKTIFLQPFGLGAALPLTATYFETRQYNKDKIENSDLEPPTKDDIRTRSQAISDNTISLRPENGSSVSKHVFGENGQGNAALGDLYTFKSVHNKGSLTDAFLGGHMIESLGATLYQRSQNEDDILTHTRHISADDILDKTAVFETGNFFSNLINTLIRIFGDFAAKFNLGNLFHEQEAPDQKRQNFFTLDERAQQQVPPTLDKKPDLNPQPPL